MQNLLIKTLGNSVLKMEARFISLKQSDISQDSSSQYFAFQSQKHNVDRVRKMRVIGMQSLASMLQSENIDLKFDIFRCNRSKFIITYALLSLTCLTPDRSIFDVNSQMCQIVFDTVQISGVQIHLQKYLTTGSISC
ncbi:Hypothetical_protein [Hexamita inflata]|uniref:Hypothetical_protein n=1 Tax=Hexamita inflata TaxID=28002 RepID=A0AA86V202_9EUKA|nr:Hypothetical protein HINF_LOCUS60826 [Hexamita inflata]